MVGAYGTSNPPPLILTGAVDADVNCRYFFHHASEVPSCPLPPTPAESSDVRIDYDFVCPCVGKFDNDHRSVYCKCIWDFMSFSDDESNGCMLHKHRSCLCPSRHDDQFLSISWL